MEEPGRWEVGTVEAHGTGAEGGGAREGCPGAEGGGGLYQSNAERPFCEERESGKSRRAAAYHGTRHRPGLT